MVPSVSRGFRNTTLLFSGSVVSSSLGPYELQHARLPCPSLSPGVCPNSRPLSWWCCPTIPSSILCHPLLLPTIFPSIRVFSSESILHIRWPNYWSFSFSICRSSEYSGLISFSIDWVQGTLKSLLQHHSSKASILRCSAFFMVQLSHLYMTTGKPIALTRWTFVSKVMSLLFNTLFRFVIAFLPGSRRLNFMARVTDHSDFGSILRCIYVETWPYMLVCPLEPPGELL